MKAFLWETECSGEESRELGWGGDLHWGTPRKRAWTGDVWDIWAGGGRWEESWVPNHNGESLPSWTMHLVFIFWSSVCNVYTDTEVVTYSKTRTLSPLSKQISALLKSAPWVCCCWAFCWLREGHGWQTALWIVALHFQKLSELWDWGSKKAVQEVAKRFPSTCQVFNDQLQEVAGQFEWGHRDRSPETGVLLVPAAPNLAHTLVLLGVLIWLIFFLSFNVCCIKSLSLILYAIRATYSVLVIMLQWPNLIVEGRVLYNVVLFSQ